jgi:hypothetical protein
MSQESDDVSSQQGVTALFSLQQHPGEFPQEYVTSVRLVDLQDILYDLQQDIDDAKADVETNVEERDFMALPPLGDANDDSVSSVGAESQFSVSSPQDVSSSNLRTQLTELRQFMDVLKIKITENSEQFFYELQQYMITKVPGIRVYGNQSIVATLGQNMLVPMLSFYGIATKDVVARGIKPIIDDIKSKIQELTCSQFTTPAGFPDSEVDCTMPTAANMVWNVRLKLNGNIFTLLTFRIVAMERLVFEQQIPGVTRECFEHYLLDKSKHVDPNAMTPLLLELGVSVVSQDGSNMHHFPHNIQYLDDTQRGRILALLQPEEVRAVFASRLRITPENYCLHLLFALLSKACAKDFNCLCAMPEIDVALFKMIAGSPLSIETLTILIQIIKSFLELLADPQLQSKRSYMITALHNLVACYVDKMIIQERGEQSMTGETLAYKKLFDGDDSGSGLNTFNPIMSQISQVIQILRSSGFGLELQVSLCGGRMIYKLGDVLRSYITQPVASNPEVIAALGGERTAIPLLNEMVKLLNLPSDSDYTLTFAGLSRLELEFVQTILMFITLCTQLGIKGIVDNFCTSQNPDAAFFLRELVVIGMSLVGGDFQLSSARNSCDALSFLDEINVKHGVDPVLTQFLQQFPRDLNRVPKSSLAPCDLVPKMPSGDYIKKIAGYVFGSGYADTSLGGVVTTQIVPNIDTIADRISRYSMSTDQGFSSPIKVLFDILFTLFSIENFTNRAFVTQKINKELKRIAICASILFFHFNELLQMPYPYLEGSPERQRINELLQAQQSHPVGSPQRQKIDTELLQFQQRLLYPEGSPQRREITTMLQILGRVINYGYNPAFKLLSTEIDNIMTAYASCFVQLLHLYSPGMDVIFYSRVPELPTPTSTSRFPAIGARNVLTSLENKCMDMLRVHTPLARDLVPRQAQAEFQAEGLPQDVLQGIIMTGVGFLNSIQERGILAMFLQLKQQVKAEDLVYKSRGEFLTSVQACETFLKGFVLMLQPPSTLLTDLQPLLAIFSNPAFAEIMHFQPVVVIKSENLTDRAKANPATAEGLKVSAESQFCIYAILSIFGVKFKSEWSKISLFTRILFYELLSMNMRAECSSLLGVDFTLIDPEKLRYSSLSYLKDKILYDRLVYCRINPETLPSLGTYYGNDKLYHGIDTYRNRLLDTRQVTYSFISPSERTPDVDVLSFQFLSSQYLQQLMMCSDPSTGKSAFYDLFQQDALQPRAYELLLKRLTDKFSILTKKCDHEVKQELTATHGGRTKKEFRMNYKLQQLDGIVTEFVSKILQATPEQRDGELIPGFIAKDSTCFEGEKVDRDKFEVLLYQDPDQCKYWIYHLLEMIMFYHNLSIVRVDLRDVWVENIKKYSKLLFLLKNYLPMDPQVVQAAIIQARQQAAGIQEAARQAATIEEAARQAAIQEAARQAAAIQEAARQAAIQEAARQAAIQEAARQAAAMQAASTLPQFTSESRAQDRDRDRDRGRDRDRDRDRNRDRDRDRDRGRSPSPGKPQNPSRGRDKSPSRSRSRSPSNRSSNIGEGGGSPKVSATKPKTRNNRYSKNARTRKNKHKRKQHRNRKYKKTTNTKSNRRTKSQSKKNVTFKRRRR